MNPPTKPLYNAAKIETITYIGVATMSDAELQTHLCTCDGRGV